MVDQQHIRQILTARYDEIVARLEKVDRDIRHVSQPLDRIMDEQSLELQNDEVLGALDDSIRDEIKHIKRTMERLDKGKYGLCEVCAKAIPDRRLEVVPYATTCVECEAKSESHKPVK